MEIPILGFNNDIRHHHPGPHRGEQKILQVLHSQGFSVASLCRLIKPSKHAADYELRTAHTKLMQTVGEKIIASKTWSGVVWDENSTRMLDYACGTGLISRVYNLPLLRDCMHQDVFTGVAGSCSLHEATDRHGYLGRYGGAIQPKSTTPESLSKPRV